MLPTQKAVVKNYNKISVDFFEIQNKIETNIKISKKKMNSLKERIYDLQNKIEIWRQNNPQDPQGLKKTEIIRRRLNSFNINLEENINKLGIKTLKTELFSNNNMKNEIVKFKDGATTTILNNELDEIELNNDEEFPLVFSFDDHSEMKVDGELWIHHSRLLKEITKGNKEKGIPLFKNLPPFSVKPQSLETVDRFLTTGNLIITQENHEELFAIADYLNIPEVLEKLLICELERVKKLLRDKLGRKGKAKKYFISKFIEIRKLAEKYDVPVKTLMTLDRFVSRFICRYQGQIENVFDQLRDNKIELKLIDFSKTKDSLTNEMVIRILNQNPSLISLNLSSHYRITDVVGEYLKKQTHLEELNLYGIQLIGLDQYLGELVNLRKLDLGQNYSIGEIESSLEKLHKLEFLNLGNSNKLGNKTLEAVGKLKNLTFLNIINLDKLTNKAMLSIKKLPLCSLVIGGGTDIKFTSDIFISLGEMTSLENLEIYGLENILNDSTIAPHLKKLVNLKSLDFNHCLNLSDEIGLVFEYLVKLKKLRLFDMPNITSKIFPLLLKLSNLKKMFVRECGFEIHEPISYFEMNGRKLKIARFKI